MTEAVVGDGVLFTGITPFRQRNGISLLINNSTSVYSENSTFKCDLPRDVGDKQMLFHCIAKRSGTFDVQINLDFCGNEWWSPLLTMRVEQKSVANTTQSDHGTYSV